MSFRRSRNPIDFGERGRRLGIVVIGETIAEGGESFGCALSFDRHDERKAEPRAIGVVKLPELAQFVRRESVKPGARLLARRLRGQRLSGCERPGKIRVRFNQSALLFHCPLRRSGGEPLRQPTRRVGAAL